jgi:hypothetical protein
MDADGRARDGYLNMLELQHARYLRYDLIVRASLGSVLRTPWLTAGQETCACMCMHIAAFEH